jgi:hypothetical protein
LQQKCQILLHSSIVAQEGSTNNTASFDAENAESVQESSNIHLISAISACVMNPNLWQPSIDMLEIASKMRR